MATLEEILTQLQQGGDPFAPSAEEKKNALTQALFTFGLGTLAAPSGGKGFSGAAQAAGRGGLMGMGAYQDALAQARQSKTQGLGLRQQLAGILRQEKEYARQDAQRSALETAQKAAVRPGKPAVMEPGERGYMEEVTPAQGGGFDPKVFLDTYASTPGADPLQALELTSKLAKLQGWRKIGEAPGGGDLYIGPDGEPKVVGKSDGKWEPIKTDANGVWLRRENGDMKYVHDTSSKISVKAYGGHAPEVPKQLDAGTADYVYKEAMPKVTAARTANNTLEAMRRNVGVTGFFTPENLTLKQGLAAMGLGSDKMKEYVARAENFTADASQLVLSEQLKQKGPQTESDARRLQLSLPDVRKSPLGNEYLIRVRMAQNNREIAYYNFISKLMMNRDMPMNMLEADQAWVNSPEGRASIFDDPLLKNWSWSPQEARGGIGGAPQVRVNRRID